MKKSGNNNYDHLFRYIIVGDMGKKKKYIIKYINNKIYSCRKIMYPPSIYRQ